MNGSKLQFYKSGIISKVSCKNDLNSLTHAVLAIGLGTEPTTGKAFYVMRNSWGPNWGENGNFRIARNEANLCGVATYASYPSL